MLSTLFPPSLVPPRSNIKISGRQKRKHALAYKRDFPLSRDPLFSKKREREEKKGVERWRVERSFRLQGETNLQTRETSRSPPRVTRYEPVKIFERELFIFGCGNFDASVERDNGLRVEQFFFFFLFCKGKISTFLIIHRRLHFRKFVVYNGYKCYDHRKINSRRVISIRCTSYSNIYLRDLNINRRNACLLPLDRWYLYASTHLFQIYRSERALWRIKRIFIYEFWYSTRPTYFSSQILPFKSGRNVNWNIFSNSSALLGGEGEERGERYVSFTTLRNYFDSILIPRTINTAVYVILYLTCWFVE